ncbi:MAG: exonuclease SbcCD subunit D [Candidatus Nanopelagicales bacterium]
MRLLHTSDWHLGRSLHREDLIPAQATFADWLVDVATAERVDAVVVAGDVFDRAVPPVDAVALADDLLARLSALGVAVVVTSGNHDSAIRLGFGARPARAGGVHLRTAVADLASPVLLTDAQGEVAVYGLPYLDPDATRAALEADRSHQSVLAAAMVRVRADAAARPDVARRVVVAHAFVQGGQACDSERDMRVGGVDSTPAGVFGVGSDAGPAYVALGHLHAAQDVAPAVRYAGSPLPYSFSEAGHTKSVTLVDLGADGSVRTEALPTPVPRAMATVTGDLEALLEDPALARWEDAWVRAVLTDSRRPEAPMERLRSRFPHALVLEFAPVGGEPSLADDLRRARATVDPVELSTRFVDYVTGGPVDDAELAVLAAAHEDALRAELSG